ncbi:MAG: DUF4199 domain-containing protein [Pseudomonadota bacterium]
MKTVSYGALIGLGLAIVVMLLDWLFPPGSISFVVAETLGYTSMVVFTALVILILRARRNETPRWGFGIALREAWAAMLVISLVFGVSLFVYWQFLQPESLLRLYEYYQQTLQAVGDESAAAQLADMERNREHYLNPAFQAGVMAATVLAVGLFVGALCAYLTRRS